jgi:hypothetical protein
VSEIGLPPHVAEFVLQHIHAVEQLRALLLLRETAPKEWSPRELCYALRTSIESASARLFDLHGRGFLSVRDDASERKYQYTGKDDALLVDVARLLETHPVSMIRLIYSRPPEELRQFADAFRLRSKKEP